MAQVTGQFSAASGKVEISDDGTTWTNISGALNTLEVTGGGRMIGETYTLDGDNALVTVGKSEPQEVNCAFVYTEGASEAFEVLRPLEAAGEPVWLRWSPGGGTTGDFMFTMSNARLSNIVYPGFDAGSGDPIMSGFTARGPRAAKSVVV